MTSVCFPFRRGHAASANTNRRGWHHAPPRALKKWRAAEHDPRTERWHPKRGVATFDSKQSGGQQPADLPSRVRQPVAERRAVPIGPHTAAVRRDDHQPSIIL
jgi:hypothetical protein